MTTIINPKPDLIMKGEKFVVYDYDSQQAIGCFDDLQSAADYCIFIAELSTFIGWTAYHPTMRVVGKVTSLSVNSYIKYYLVTADDAHTVSPMDLKIIAREDGYPLPDVEKINYHINHIIIRYPEEIEVLLRFNKFSAPLATEVHIRNLIQLYIEEHVPSQEQNFTYTDIKLMIIMFTHKIEEVLCH